MAEGKSKWKQGFYDEAPEIVLKDPLAYVLGAMEQDEVMVFRYPDAVKLAGHSCPAVSGAYIATFIALKRLYEDEIPVRGSIKVTVKGAPDDLAYGPMSQVISFITGASPVTGFKGLGKFYSRKNLLIFDEENPELNTFIFERLDNFKKVKIIYNPSVLPQSPKISEILPKILSKQATKPEKDEFISLWQENVKKILLQRDKIEGLFVLQEI